MTDTETKKPNEEFDQFEDLTRQLLAVSKKELDEKKRTDSDPPQAKLPRTAKID